MNHVSMMYRFQIQKYILSEVFRVYKPQEPLTFEPYLHVCMTFKNFTHFLNKKVSSRHYDPVADQVIQPGDYPGD